MTTTRKILCDAGTGNVFFSLASRDSREITMHACISKRSPAARRDSEAAYDRTTARRSIRQLKPSRHQALFSIVRKPSVLSSSPNTRACLHPACPSTLGSHGCPVLRVHDSAIGVPSCASW